jgi:hypothetical protein
MLKQRLERVFQHPQLAMSADATKLLFGIKFKRALAAQRKTIAPFCQ